MKTMKSMSLPRFLLALRQGPAKRFARDEGGASAVEFAMISSVLILVLLNVVDLGNYMFRKMELTSSVRAGAQYALVHDAPTQAAIQTVVSNASNMEGVAIAVNDTICGCADGTTFVCGAGTCTGSNLRYYTQIQATYTHNWIFLPGQKTMQTAMNIRTE